MSGGFAWDDIFRVFRAGLVFDSSAIFYLNAPYLLLVLLPFHVKDRSVLIQRIEKWLYMIPNSLAIVLNIGDAAAYVYRGAGRAPWCSVSLPMKATWREWFCQNCCRMVACTDGSGNDRRTCGGIPPSAAA